MSDERTIQERLRSQQRCSTYINWGHEAADRIDALQAHIEMLRGALTASAAKFREYEQLHMAKGSIDGDVKARTNAQMAELCEATISSTPVSDVLLSTGEFHQEKETR